MADPALTPHADRELLAQLCFEQFGVQGMFVSSQAVAALYAVGRTSGIVVDYGFEKTGGCAGGVMVPAGSVDMASTHSAWAEDRGVGSMAMPG